MTKRKRTQKQSTKTFKRLSKSLSEGELGWFRQADPYNLKQKMYTENSVDLKKLHQWIQEAIHGKQEQIKERFKNYGTVQKIVSESVNDEKNESLAPSCDNFENVLNDNISRESINHITSDNDQKDSIIESRDSESIDASGDENPDPSINESTKIIIIDLLKRGYEKLIVGNKNVDDTFEFKLEQPVVIRAKYFSAKAREIIELQGGICIDINN